MTNEEKSENIASYLLHLNEHRVKEWNIAKVAAFRMSEWKDSEYSWQEIPKDKHGFYDDLKKNLYGELPIIVCCNQDGMYPILEYIDKDNWADAVSDLSKPNYHYYMKVQPLKVMEE